LNHVVPGYISPVALWDKGREHKYSAAPRTFGHRDNATGFFTNRSKKILHCRTEIVPGNNVGISLARAYGQSAVRVNMPIMKQPFDKMLR